MTNLYKFTYAIIGLWLLSTASGIAQTSISSSASIISGGRTRTFRYHLPDHLPKDNLPLVIVYHGDGGNGAGIESYSGFDALADSQNFIVIYPDAVSVGGGIQFNKYADNATGFGSTGDNDGPNPADPTAPDDVLFTSDLIDNFYQKYRINRNRVYATGHSGGGFMAYFLSVAMPNKIAAIAPVAASLWANQAFFNTYINGNQFKNIPILHIHSKGDNVVDCPIIPYPKIPDYVYPLSSFAYRSCGNGNNYTTHALNANVDSLTFCSTPKKITLLITKDATHGWSSQFNVAQTIWRFFKNYSLNSFPEIDNHLKIDQFGYLPNAKKVAVISNPQTGYNNTEPFSPSIYYQIRRETDNQVVFNGSPQSWNLGTTHVQSGDKVWWFDFSNVKQNGTYYVYDSLKNKRSYPFEINNDAYKNVLKQASRVFFYQRSGFAKNTPYAESPWTDGLSFLGAQQDTDCRLVTNTNASTSQNLRGGWFDAGDYNKYVPFTFTTLTDMLLAYEDNKAVWTDDFNIPESNNGVPDLLDEIKWELDWLKRMQQTNGSLLHKVSVTDYASTSPPSADHNFRRYGAASTIATATGAAVFALAAIQYKSLSNIAMQKYGDTLQNAAIKAFIWANNNPNVAFINTGFQSADAAYTAYDQLARRVSAAAFLYVLTGDVSYRTFFDANYTQVHLMQWSFAYPFESSYQDALLYYTKATGATSSVKTAILNTYLNSIKTNNNDNLPSFLNNSDAYRAYLKDSDYTWGSNQTKSHQGSMFLSMNTYQQDLSNANNYRDAAMGFIHYLHGVNPTGYSYLTNMSQYGGAFSVPTIYHAWFGDGTVFDTNPPPAYLVGGANPTYTPDGSYSGATLAPPLNQPVQKSYKAWNTSFPENAWELNEPAIYYQSAYLRLLAQATCYTDKVESVKSGNWNDATTWSCLKIPNASSQVVVAASHIITVNSIVAAKSMIVKGQVNIIGNNKININP